MNRKLIFFLILIPLNFIFTQNINPIVLKDNILDQGGNVLLIIFGLSFIAFVIIFFLLFTLRTNVFIPSNLSRKIEACIKIKDYPNLLKMCKKNSSPIAKIHYNISKEFIKKEKIDNKSLHILFEQQGKLQIEKIEQKLNYILDIASIAPMIGLLGTVLGMYESFTDIGTDIKSIRPIALANGISKALVTTIAGIFLSIILNFFHSILANQKKSLVSKLEYYCLLSYREMKK